MAGIVRRAAFTDDDMPAALKVRNEVTKEVWEEETEAFQQEVKTNLEREYQASLAAWKNSLADSPTKTPEEMNA
jgi:ABC-type transporter MlaC component